MKVALVPVSKTTILIRGTFALLGIIYLYTCYNTEVHLVDLLTLEEKISLVHGSIVRSKCAYTGVIKGVPRLLIPELRHNDGPQGFRGPAGLSTAYPCALAIAATFDTHAAFDWAHSIAEEFKEKGANVLLGPGVNVLRVPSNGRAFEYSSGEDPVLGSMMTSSIVKGIVHAKGIIATVKHFALNSQETNRTSISSNVDDITLNEVYLRPFKSAIDAGALAVMCSYNLIDGVYACQNQRLLEDKLKSEWGFKGFVVSDWGATHSASTYNGLDQEMPVGIFFGSTLRELARSNATVMNLVKDKAKRVLHAIHAAGIVENPPCSLSVDTTLISRSKKATSLASASCALLSNENEFLPLNKTRVKVVAVVGSAAVSMSVLTGGGSGRVDAGMNSITALDGLRTEHPLGEIRYSDGVDLQEVKRIATGADVVVLVLSQMSDEGLDRASLRFSDSDESLVHFLADEKFNLVLVSIAPGPIAMPWWAKVPVILNFFMPGQNFGTSLANIIYGVDEPGGRLPVTFPVNEGVRFDTVQFPGVNGNSNFTEKAFVGYRWFEKFAPENVAFPFGHGLGFSSFRYDEDFSVHPDFPRSWTFRIGVLNTGVRPSSEVVQIYLIRQCNEAAYQRPVKVLVGFTKTNFRPNQRKVVSVKMHFEDVAEWNGHAWEIPSELCDYNISIGSSSRRIRTSNVFKFQ